MPTLSSIKNKYANYRKDSKIESSYFIVNQEINNSIYLFVSGLSTKNQEIINDEKILSHLQYADVKDILVIHNLAVKLNYNLCENGDIFNLQNKDSEFIYELLKNNYKPDNMFVLLMEKGNNYYIEKAFNECKHLLCPEFQEYIETYMIFS